MAESSTGPSSVRIKDLFEVDPTKDNIMPQSGINFMFYPSKGILRDEQFRNVDSL